MKDDAKVERLVEAPTPESGKMSEAVPVSWFPFKEPTVPTPPPDPKK